MPTKQIDVDVIRKTVTKRLHRTMKANVHDAFDVGDVEVAQPTPKLFKRIGVA